MTAHEIKKLAWSRDSEHILQTADFELSDNISQAD